MTSQQAIWKKVVFEEPDGSVGVRQGYFYDEDDFVRVVGDRTECLIRKSKIVSITSKLTGVNNEIR